MLRRIVIFASTIALLSSCAMIRNMHVNDKLEKTSKSFNQMIRWNDTEMAAKSFLPEKLQDEFKQKVQGIKITDYRVKNTVCTPEKNEATVIVELDYYREPSVKMHTVTYVEKWEYAEVGGSMGWQLTNLPPDMK